MQLVKLSCPKCGYQWIPRVENPKKCPKCGHRKGIINNKNVEWHHRLPDGKLVRCKP